MTRGLLALTALTPLLVLLAAPAAAEIYKCVGPDGQITFTSSPDACRGAVPHQPRGTVQRVPSAAAPSRAPARRAPSAAVADDEARAQRWRARRKNALAEQAKLAQEVEAYRQIVTGCNRGFTWNVEDETGIKKDFSCDGARASYAAKQQRLAELDEYLDHGLADECRRAGCLPGWVR